MAQRRIIVIDDNEDDRLFIQRAFAKEAPDARILLYESADTAIEDMRRDGPGALPDLILLDINLVDLNGFDALQRIRGSPELMACVVIILSTSKAPRDVLRAYRLKANAFMSKPEDLTAFGEVAERICAFWFESATLPSNI